RFRREVVARFDEAVLRDAVLLVVQLTVPAARREQLLVRAALDDLAVLEHENLVRALNRRQPVGDDERRASLSQRLQAVLDHRLALAVEARRRFVEDRSEERRVGKEGMSRWAL